MASHLEKMSSRALWATTVAIASAPGGCTASLLLQVVETIQAMRMDSFSGKTGRSEKIVSA